MTRGRFRTAIAMLLAGAALAAPAVMAGPATHRADKANGDSGARGVGGVKRTAARAGSATLAERGSQHAVCRAV